MTLLVSTQPARAAGRLSRIKPSEFFRRKILKIPGWFVLLAIVCLVASVALQVSFGLPEVVAYGAVVGVLGAAMPFAFKQNTPPAS